MTTANKPWFLFLSNKYSLAVLLCLISSITWAQAPEIGLWTGVSVQKNIRQSFALHLNTQVRFSENISVTRAFLGELGLSYKLNKQWKVSGYYRYTGRRRQNNETEAYYYRSYHRFYGDISYDRKIWKLKFDYRLRYQHQFKDDNSGLESDNSYLRNKFELSYPNKSRFTPFVSTDIFYLIGEEFDQMRNKAGVEISLHRHHTFDVYGFTDYQLVGRQKNQLIFGFSYKVKF